MTDTSDGELKSKENEISTKYMKYIHRSKSLREGEKKVVKDEKMERKLTCEKRKVQTRKLK